MNERTSDASRITLLVDPQHVLALRRDLILNDEVERTTVAHEWEIDPAGQRQCPRIVVTGIHFHQLVDAIARVTLELHAREVSEADRAQHSPPECLNFRKHHAAHCRRKTDELRFVVQLLRSELGADLTLDGERVVVHAATVVAGNEFAQHQWTAAGQCQR